MAVAVTNSTVSLNSAVNKTFNAATADTADLAEVFTITPTKADYKTVIEISNVTGILAYSIAAGDLWAGKAVTGTVAANKTVIIEVEGGKVMQNDGTILLTLTPASGTKLLTNHAASVQVIQTL